VTFCCYRLLPFLTEDRAKELLIKYLAESRNKYGYKLLGYVIMPEHVHLVLLPPDNMKLGLMIREIKSKMAREYFSLNMKETSSKNVFWQKRCYDHNCRSAESAKEKINYCHNNPVKRGLAAEPGNYKWSSHNWYRGESDVTIFMDEYEM
jgi:putative transposase